MTRARLRPWLPLLSAGLDGDQLEERLWAECLTASRASKADDDAEWTASQAEHREAWTGLDRIVRHPLAVARRQRLGDVA